MLNFPDLSPEDLMQCLPSAGLTLSALDQSYLLPYVRKDHDLVDYLAFVVMKDASSHMKRPLNEVMSTILSTQKLTQVAHMEMKRLGISIKFFAQVLEMNAATFSLSLREPRHWFDANLVQVILDFQAHSMKMYGYFLHFFRKNATTFCTYG